jgi:hypothetical protein
VETPNALEPVLSLCSSLCNRQVVGTFVGTGAAPGAFGWINCQIRFHYVLLLFFMVVTFLMQEEKKSNGLVK